jgi:hypothetical protein
MKFLLLLILLIHQVAVSNENIDETNIFKLNSKPERINTPFVIWSTFSPVVQDVRNGINYTIYLRCKLDHCYNGKEAIVPINFLETSDPKFISPEGIRVGYDFNSIPDKFSYGEECKLLISGWHVCSGVDFSAGHTRYTGKVSRFIKELPSAKK